MASRRGRKRNAEAERYPCGKIRPQDVTPREAADDVASWSRIKRDAKQIARQPIFGTEVGRLLYFEKIRPIEADAAKNYANLVASYRRHVTGAPDNNPKVASMEVGMGRSIASPPDENYVEALKDRYDKAYIALIDRVDGVAIARAVNQLCIDDAPLTFEELGLARRGLMALAKHFGLIRKAA